MNIYSYSFHGYSPYSVRKEIRVIICYTNTYKAKCTCEQKGYYEILPHFFLCWPSYTFHVSAFVNQRYQHVE
jgi:hypothetical protein